MNYSSISQKIQIIQVSTYTRLTEKIRPSLVDEKDIPYVVAALVCKAKIWSNDKHLKAQSLVQVFTTTELLKKLDEEEIDERYERLPRR